MDLRPADSEAALVALAALAYSDTDLDRCQRLRGVAPRDRYRLMPKTLGMLAVPFELTSARPRRPRQVACAAQQRPDS